MKKNKIYFTKMTAAGNDFIIIDARAKKNPKPKRKEFAKKICDRHFGVGADGLFFIEKAKNKENNFAWDFYNADGSIAEMCGNGARCVARYCFDNKIAPKKMKFETLSGVVGAEVFKNQIKIQMPKIKIIFKSINIPSELNEKINATYLTAGVPHIVKENSDWSQEYLFDVGEFLRNHASLEKTNGANATFFEIIGPSKIQAATFERGVEDITLACGTGAVAAAVAASLRGEKSPIKVNMPGGTMTVVLSSDLQSAELIGEAEYICNGEILFG
ncbi:MAG: diaminopimelate epimerase [Oligoflexia bacterium]|nr:diaminopimelate epimerase [Oligoflexia bacterium]